MRTIVFSFLMFMTFAISASPTLLVDVSDPTGDDFGSGNLVYPLRGDFAKGDLDLTRFTITREGDGFWLSAYFSNAIKDPAKFTASNSADTLAMLARKGFFQFNIDVYIDTDRKPESGNMFTLPGRKVRVDSDYAWERAVVLTPRPEVSRGALIDALKKQYPDQPERAINESIDQTIFFPTNVRVRGKVISFFVPRKFIGESDGSDWAATVFVTGADVSSSLNMGLGRLKQLPLEEFTMSVMQPSEGQPTDTFGFTGLGDSSFPLIDVLVPTIGQQMHLLSKGIPLTGVSWGIHSAKEIENSEKYAGAVSSRKAISADLPTTRSSLGALKELLGLSEDISSQPRKAGNPAPKVNTLLDSSTHRAKDEVITDSAVGTKKPPIEARLKLLLQLYEKKVIDELEYKTQRQRLLGEL